jgi:hypothetical protein
MANIGIHPHEIGRRQELMVSISRGVDSPQKDGIAKAVVQRGFGLIDWFALVLACGYLAIDQVFAATLRVAKADALPNGLA